MNRITHIRSNAALGLAAWRCGLSCTADMTRFVQAASAQAGVGATQ